MLAVDGLFKRADGFRQLHSGPLRVGDDLLSAYDTRALGATEALSAAAVADAHIGAELWCAATRTDAAGVGKIAYAGAAGRRRHGSTGIDAALFGCATTPAERVVHGHNDLIDRDLAVEVEVALARRVSLCPRCVSVEARCRDRQNCDHPDAAFHA